MSILQNNNLKDCDYTTVDGRVLLLGLDFGSTTSSALVAEAAIISNTSTGQMEFGQVRIIFRSEISLTPFLSEKIDILQIDQMIDSWLAASRLKPEDFFSGGVIITGLAARRENSLALVKLIEEKIGEVLIATADDPGLESWLSFMGSCAAMSRLHAKIPILNLDIGGGTTNPALGINGQVRATGCYFIGARHFQFVPGTYRITQMTNEGRKLLALLNINKTIGDLLQPAEVAALTGWMVAALEAIVDGNNAYFDQFPECVQLPLQLLPLGEKPVPTFSGGVGELVYRKVLGEALPSTTYYGDLGIDLAYAIAASPKLSAGFKTLIPENQGRATVYGLTLHSTEVSGTTLYLPNPELLPLRHLPVIAQIDECATEDEWQGVFERLATYPNGAAIQILPEPSFDMNSVRTLGQRIAGILRKISFKPAQSVVLLYHHNAAKTLGSYASDWGRIALNLVVIDEVKVRNAGFVNIGVPYKQIIPIAFYGMY